MNCEICAAMVCAACAADLSSCEIRVATEMRFDDASTATGVTYLATADNEAWLGEASELEIAEHICRSSGPSGDNSDYLLELADALRDLGLEDAHVFGIETHIRRIQQDEGQPTA